MTTSARVGCRLSQFQTIASAYDLGVSRYISPAGDRDGGDGPDDEDGGDGGGRHRDVWPLPRRVAESRRGERLERNVRQELADDPEGGDRRDERHDREPEREDASDRVRARAQERGDRD